MKVPGTTSMTPASVTKRSIGRDRFTVTLDRLTTRAGESHCPTMRSPILIRFSGTFSRLLLIRPRCPCHPLVALLPGESYPASRRGSSADRARVSVCAHVARELDVSCDRTRGRHNVRAANTNASTSHVEIIKQHNIIQSMSRKGNCWDNAVAESFFHTLKTELTHQCKFRSREEARNIIFEYIEVFYNRVRIHSANDYLSPAEFEALTETKALQKTA